MKHLQLTTETNEHFELFEMFCRYSSNNIKDFYNSNRNDIKLSLSSIQKISLKNNWLNRKQSALTNIEGIELNIKNKILFHLNTLLENNKLTANELQDIAKAFNLLMQSQITTNKTSNTSDTVKVFDKNHKTTPKQKENETVAIVSDIFNQTEKPAQLENESEMQFERFCRFVEFENNNISEFGRILENETNGNTTAKSINIVATKHNWLSRKKVFLEKIHNENSN
jgi:hypothetical protein